jgi:hypothetical protein
MSAMRPVPRTEDERQLERIISRQWEIVTMCDSIATIEAVYDKSDSGAYMCPVPECDVRRKDSIAMWRHVHTAHYGDQLPPVGWKPEVYQ